MMLPRRRLDEMGDDAAGELPPIRMDVQRQTIPLSPPGKTPCTKICAAAPNCLWTARADL